MTGELCTIPWEVKDGDGKICTDRYSVLNKWKTDYECLFNAGQDNPYYDNTHLENVRKIRWIVIPAAHIFRL